MLDYANHHRLTELLPMPAEVKDLLLQGVNRFPELPLERTVKHTIPVSYLGTHLPAALLTC